jgi:DNA sulfur modification protein DndB
MIENLLSRDSLKGLARQQSLDEVRKTIKPKELDEALSDDWQVRKKNARTVNVVRPKKRSALLESRVWTLLYRMGFTHMSGRGGAFVRITPQDPESPKSQIDVVAVDSEVALCVECKSFEAPKKEPKIQEKLGRLESIRRPFSTLIGKAVPNKGKRHVAALMFTWDVILTESDRARAQEANVGIFDVADLEYFEALVRLLGVAARYQFLAEVFRGRQITGLELRVPALRSRMGSLNWYTFAIRPDYLLKIAYIAHRAKGKAIDLDAYQRMISKSRLRKIGEYITAEGVFPTNIVVNIENEKHVRFERGRQEGDDDNALFGWLTLSPTYGAAWIIDGQHRLFAYSGHPRAQGSFLNVLAFSGLDAGKQAQLFVDINSEQRRVKRSLLVELDAVLKWDSEDDEKRINAIISRAGVALDEELTSPLRDRLQLADVPRTETRCITLKPSPRRSTSPAFSLRPERRESPNTAPSGGTTQRTRYAARFG